MNVAGHVSIAVAIAPDDPDVWLGAALPDIGAMGRFRLLGASSSEEITRGIALHHATDEAFHSHPWFTGAMARLRSSLELEGVERGPQRAIAHVGPELLLDGELLSRPGGRAAVTTAMRSIPNTTPHLTGLVRSDRVTAWTHHLADVAGYPAPADYDDPWAVARRLHRILARRRRLSFPAALIDAAGRCLADEHDTLLAGVDGLLADLQRDLTP